MKINGNLMTLLAIHKKLFLYDLYQSTLCYNYTSPLKVCNLNSKIQSDHIGVFFSAILIIIVVAVHKSYRSYATGSDDAAFYIAAVSICPLFYGAAMGFLVARTMVFDDGKEDEERIHQERKKRRREKREPIFMFPPTGTTIPEIKRKPIAGIVVTSDDFQRTETEEPFYFKTLNVRNTGKYESTLQEKEVEEISAKTEQYEVNPILDESEASMDKHDVHNPSSGLSTSPIPPRPVTPIDVEEEITSLPLEEEHNENKGKRKKKGPMNFESTDAPLKVGNLMSLALNMSKKKSKVKKKKTKQGRSNSAFDTEEHEPGKVDVHGQTKTHSHTFEQLPEVDK